MNVAFKEPEPPVRSLDAIAEALLLPSGIDGVYARTAAFENVVDGLARSDFASSRAGNGSVALSAGDEPPAIGEVRLSEKLPAFSRLRLLPCRHRSEIGGAVDRFEAGQDWTPALSAADLVLSPAACYPVYPLAASRGEVPAEGLLFDVAGDCFRREPSKDLDRLQSFRMREYRLRRHARSRSTISAGAGSPGRRASPGGSACYQIDHASDAFFGRGGKLMAMSQIEQALKFELLVPVRSAEEPTACMSFNYHRDHFGAAWNLRDGAGRGGQYRLRRLRHGSPGAGAVYRRMARRSQLARDGARGRCGF